jgi:ribonucleoside-diphosphate reductase alpha chain
MQIPRHFTQPDKPIADQIKWKIVRAFIPEVVDMDVEVPEWWSQNAANILAKNYLRKAGVPQRTERRTYNFEVGNEPSWLWPQVAIKDKLGGETSAKQVFHRLAGHWTYVGWKHKYFSSESDARAFYDEIYWMLAHQIAAPNSPQFFNTGLWWAYGIDGPASGQWAINYSTGEPFETKSAYEFPQPHACFIQPVVDDLVNPGGIMDLWVREVRLFKQGSGTGSNFSSIRGRGEALSGGGVSGGLMSFLRIGDRAAGAIASGGTTRRAAKMVCVDLDHPEIEDFIEWKVREERKALALNMGSEILSREDGGDIYPLGWEGEAIDTVSGQNSNNSVRVTDAFLAAVDRDGDWELRARTDGRVVKTLKARDLWAKICHGAWASADPGVQFHDTINAWHTCPNDGEINASNPCSEYMFLDNTACNLASINLVAVLPRGRIDGKPNGALDLESFQHTTRLWTIVLDISVTMASFPSREIALGSYNYRTLGLGYANLGGLLMRLGIPYDSDKGRNLAAGLTALMTGISYKTSADLADELGSFPRWKMNVEPMNMVLRNHARACVPYFTISGPTPITLGPYENLKINPGIEGHFEFEDNLSKCIQFYWLNVVKAKSFRNAQVTLLAPTGTISFVMDCDTTGVEPDLALIKHKNLAGGGTMEIVNESVIPALLTLGYKIHEANLIVAYVKAHGTVEGCPDLKPEHLPVFDCTNAPEGFSRTLAPMAHVKMVAAVQPFLSGAVSKTINMPNSSTIEDVDVVYREAHRLGLKAVAIYRDGSKLTQPLSAKVTVPKLKQAPKVEHLYADLISEPAPVRRLVPRQVSEQKPRIDLPELLLKNPSPMLERGERERLPARCSGYCQKFRIDDHPVYVHTGEYPDGRLGQIFIEMSDEGSTLRALANALAKAVSIGIQFGTPPEEYVEAFVAARFEPAGVVEGHESIKMVSSVLSAIFRDLGIHYFGRMDLANIPQEVKSEPPTTVEAAKSVGAAAVPAGRPTGHFCRSCGTLMRQSSVCFTCPGCGETSGCG